MADSTTPTVNRRLAAILLLALVLRAGVFIAAVVSHDDLGVFHQPDTHTYVRGAEQMLFEGRFSLENGQPDILRTPGYPLFLMPGIWLGHVELITIGLQILLSVATVWLVYRTARLSFDRIGVAQLGALLYAMEPLSITYCSYLLTETLFTFLVVLSVFQLVVFLKHGALRNLALSALTIAAATYVRPAGYFLAPMLAGLLCLRCLAKPRQPARALGHAVAFGVISMGIIGLWQVRNYARTGYHRFSAISDHGIYCHGASVAAQLNGKTYDQQLVEWGYWDVESLYAIAPELRGAGPLAQYEYMHDKGVEMIMQHPILFATTYPKGIVWTLTDPATPVNLRLINRMPDGFKSSVRETLARRGVIAGLCEMSLKYPLAFLITALCGAITLSYYLLSAFAVLKHRALLINMPMAVVLSVNLYLILVAGGVMVSHRYRLPAMPMICIVAGLGLAMVALRVTRGRYVASDQPIAPDVSNDGSERHLDAA